MLVKDAAALAAKRVLDEHWNGKFPVDPVRVAQALDMNVEFASLRAGLSGAIIAQNGQVDILIDATENFGRQMFTCAHEIGHYFERATKGDTDFSFTDERGTKYDLSEFYADEFAGNLLMPETPFRKAWKETRSPNYLSAHFGVSAAAVRKRMERLGLA